MGRRELDESDFELMLMAAFRSPVVGAILTGVSFVFALIVVSFQGVMGAGAVILGLVILFVSLVFGGFTLAGFLSRRWHESQRVVRRGAGRGMGVWASRGMSPLPSRPVWHPPAAAQPLLSQGEQAFYLPLREIMGERYVIAIKPSLADVLQCRNRRLHQQVARMHIDFLLCDPRTLIPKLAIELDDQSHQRVERIRADQWKAQLLAERGISLLRLPCEQAYDMQRLREMVEHAGSTVQPIR